MNFSDNYIENDGRKVFTHSFRKVYEEIESAPESYENDECNDYEEYIDEHDCKCKKRQPKIIEVDKVLGIGAGSTTAEVCIPLCPPAVEVMTCLAVEKVVFDVLVAKKNKVFINGRLLKNIPFKTRCISKFTGCGCIPALMCDTKCAIAEVPFIICINVPGAVEGAKVVVLDYDVNAVNIPNCGCGCLIRSIKETDCIWVKVKAVKPTIVKLRHEYCEEY